MVQTAVTQVIQSLADLEENFRVSRSVNPDFFMEWRTDLPSLLELESETLNKVRDRFRYQRHQGPVAEGAVNAIVVSPLLGLAGFYDPPFHLRSEVSVALQTTIQIEDSEVEMGIPQILTYMMAAPTQQSTMFGMVTNGNHFVFIKLNRGRSAEYDFSDTFSLLPQSNLLYDVLQILKRIGTIVLAS